MNKHWIIGLIAFAFLIGMASCSKEYKKYSTWSRKGSISEKDSAAFFFYQRGDYEKAAFLFEDLRPAYRGTDRAKTIMYHYAYAKYHFGLYVVGAYYFEQFVKQFPNDDLTPECTFMIGYCYYLEAAPYQLDQTFTDKAIAQLQLFIDTYPYHEKVEDCNRLLIELRERKAQKEFESARLYYHVENYRAAVTAFDVMIQEFPDSRYREEAQFLWFKSAVRLADVSSSRRKKNRYLDALDQYQSFVDKYPNSPFLKEAEDLFVKAKRNLGKIMAEENAK
ncbi:MAG: outer membrane protein assembly factor BamD [Bacteroidota bacterium]